MARLLLLQALWEPARMQAAGLAYALDPWLQRCHADPEALRAARERHLAYFNTQPYAAWLLAGVLCELEETGAVARVAVVRKSFAASLAGVFDGFFWGALRPFAMLAGLALAVTLFRLDAPGAVPAGIAAALLIYNVPALALRWIGFTRGYALGERAVAEAAAWPVQAWTRRLRLASAACAVLLLVLAALRPGIGAAAATRIGAVSAAGLALSWKGVPWTVQVAAAAVAGTVAAAAGWLA